MLIVTFEIWPGGNEREKRVVERLEITNLGASDDEGGALYSCTSKSFRPFALDGYRPGGVLKLVRQALDHIVRHSNAFPGDKDVP